MTLGELRQRMTNDELLSWSAYVEINGPLNPMLRFDSAIARVAAPFFKNAKPADLMVWPREQEREATPQEIFAVLMNSAKRNKTH